MSLTDLIPIPAQMNCNLCPARQITMKALLGSPRHTYGRGCQGVTNPHLKSQMKTASVGPFRVHGLSKAVDSLGEVMADIKAERSDIHDALGSAGMLCVRFVRGSRSSISNHSWGTAIDLTLDGLPVDPRGDGLCQRGLAEIAPIFNRHGWFWGAGFRTEDAMHFEIADETIRGWYPEAANIRQALSFGDRGDRVRDLQQSLLDEGFDLIVDGVFGPGTHAQVMAYQAEKRLVVDGIVGPNTLQALGLA